MNDLVTYTPPSAAELEATLNLALRLSKTNFVPAAYRGKPDETLACMLTGRELGIGQMQALRDIFIQNGRPAMMATLMAQLARRAGHKVTVLEHTDTQCTIQIHRRDKQRPEQPLTWTMEDAKTAGLLGKDNWRHYPKAMLWNRAVSAAVRRDCSEVLGGVLYTPEELGAGDTEVTWGEIEVDQTTGEVLDESPGPVQVTPSPAGPGAASVPTLEQIKRLRSIQQARALADTAPDEFKHALLNQFNHQDEWRAFWKDAGLDSWRDHLHDALTTLSDQTAAAGVSIPPAGPPADPNGTGPGRAEPVATGKDSDSATTPGPAPNPDRGDD